MAKRKEHTRGTVRAEERFTCTNSSCGFVFSKPIRVKNLCEDAEIYDACPRCFTAVTEVDNIPVIEAEQNPNVDTERSEVTSKVGIKKAEPGASKQCTHRFGYLSVRPKNEPIPDDCLMCENIVKCMTKGITA
jgi:hypothetical protein